MEVCSWDNHRTQWWMFQLAIFSKTRSLKSPGRLLAGLLLEVAILAKKQLKKSDIFSQKNIEENQKTTKEKNPHIPKGIHQNRNKTQKTEQIAQKKQQTTLKYSKQLKNKQTIKKKFDKNDKQTQT